MATRSEGLEAYIQQAKAYMAKAAPGDLVGRHLMLPVRLAHRWRNKGVRFDDLLQEANLALLQAARDYPGSESKKRGVPFIQYATKAITIRIITAIRAANPAGLHIDSRTWDRMRAIRRAAAKLRARFEAEGDPDREPTCEELAEATGFDVEDVKHLHWLADAKAAIESLEADRFREDDGDDPWEGALADESENVEQEVMDRLEAEEHRERVVRLVEKLPPGARRAISLRYGLRMESLEGVCLGDWLGTSRNLPVVAASANRRLRSWFKEGVERPGDYGRNTTPELVMAPQDRMDSVDASYARLPTGSQERDLLAAYLWRLLAGGRKTPEVDTRQRVHPRAVGSES